MSRIPTKDCGGKSCWLLPRERRHKPGCLITSPTLLGPVMVWSQQNLSEIAIHRSLFRVLSSLLLPRPPPKKSGRVNKWASFPQTGCMFETLLVVCDLLPWRQTWRLRFLTCSQRRAVPEALAKVEPVEARTRAFTAQATARAEGSGSGSAQRQSVHRTTETKRTGRNVCFWLVCIARKGVCVELQGATSTGTTKREHVATKCARGPEWLTRSSKATMSVCYSNSTFGSSLGQGFPTFLWPCTPSAHRQTSVYP